ncbi:MAG: putative Fe-S cluster assembly protein SufT [Candidatus Marinimicrobia bacterium]|nr:putative Fe-S cluster assembly protein SufT [Candidatus Neomarinimicrobiota bacterium]MBL7047603.1 putative Fe-S cluster assembly protein SufT [Candidatus Neomarinimicrobiota bacterium]
MEAHETVTFTRDCEATRIPDGTKITILKGEEALITQALGGSYTLLIRGNLFRLEGKDGNAIGKESEAQPLETVRGRNDLDKTVWKVMKTCYDPEIPINIVDLGLIYSCDIFPLENGGTRVEVKMTLTAPGCGMGGILSEEVRSKLCSISEVSECDVRLVFEPQWNRDMMSEAAKLQLGIL